MIFKSVFYLHSLRVCYSWVNVTSYYNFFFLTFCRCMHEPKLEDNDVFSPLARNEWLWLVYETVSCMVPGCGQQMSVLLCGGAKRL